MPLSEFESETSAFGGQRSIQLSYRGERCRILPYARVKVKFGERYSVFRSANLFGDGYLVNESGNLHQKRVARHGFASCVTGQPTDWFFHGLVDQGAQAIQAVAASIGVCQLQVGHQFGQALV